MAALTPPDAPAEYSAPAAPSGLGGGVPPPLLWSVIQTVIPDVWPDGDPTALRASATAWQGFASTIKGIVGHLTAPSGVEQHHLLRATGNIRMAMDWRVPINEILFGLKFTQEITAETIRWNADNAVHYKVLDLGPETYYQAIGDALASGERLDGLGQLRQFDQAQIAGFLRALATQLDALRPWPEPKFRRLEPATWATFEHAVPIARLDASVVQVTNVLKKGFWPAGDAEPGLYVMMLNLATGETVALLGSYARGEKVTLLTDSVSDPADVVEHFTDATGFAANKITRI